MLKLIIYGLIVHLFFLTSIFVIYFQSPIITDLQPQKDIIEFITSEFHHIHHHYNNVFQDQQQQQNQSPESKDNGIRGSGSSSSSSIMNNIHDDEPPAKRIVIFISDGLRAESFYRQQLKNTQFLRDIIIKHPNRIFGISNTRVPTESRPGHVAMFAGFYEDPSAVFKGWQENPVNFDSIFNRSAVSYGWGSPDILSIFVKGHQKQEQQSQQSQQSQKSQSQQQQQRLQYIRRNVNKQKINFHSYNENDEDFSGKSNTILLDQWVFTNVFEFLQNNFTIIENQSKLIIFLHLLGLDVAGHVHKPNTKLFLDNLRAVDGGIKMITELMEKKFPDKKTSYIFTSDHGMTDYGSHGSGSSYETETPFIGWGAGFRNLHTIAQLENHNFNLYNTQSPQIPNYPKSPSSIPPIDHQDDDFNILSIGKITNTNKINPNNPNNPNNNNNFNIELEQIALTPLIATLIGTAVAVNNLGTLPYHLLDNVSERYKAIALFNNALQIYQQYLKLYNDFLNGKLQKILFNYNRLTKAIGKQLIKTIKQTILNENYPKSIELTEKLIQLSLSGIEYYHNYYQFALLLAITISIIGWIFYLMEKLLKTPQSKNVGGQSSMTTIPVPDDSNFSIVDGHHQLNSNEFKQMGKINYIKLLFIFNRNYYYLLSMIFKVYFLYFLCTIIFIYLQNIPILIGLYFLLPIFCWLPFTINLYQRYYFDIQKLTDNQYHNHSTADDADYDFNRKKYYKTLFNNTGNLLKTFKLIAIYFIGIELLVISFFYRQSLTIILLFIIFIELYKMLFILNKSGNLQYTTTMMMNGNGNGRGRIGTVNFSEQHSSHCNKIHNYNFYKILWLITLFLLSIFPMLSISQKIIIDNKNLLLIFSIILWFIKLTIELIDQQQTIISNSNVDVGHSNNNNNNFMINTNTKKTSIFYGNIKNFKLINYILFIISAILLLIRIYENSENFITIKIIQICSWTIFIFVIFIILSSRNYLFNRFLIIINNLAIIYLLLSISYEPIFLLILSENLYYLINIEYDEQHLNLNTNIIMKNLITFRGGDDDDDDDDDGNDVKKQKTGTIYRSSSSSSSVNVNATIPNNLNSMKLIYYDTITWKTIQYSFYIILYIFLSFFGTGNLASISSFDPNSIRCFLAVFQPYLMTILIVFKLCIPLIVVNCTLRCIKILTKQSMKIYFICILLMLDLMSINFLYLIKNTGSWLDIGTSISHFVIIESTIIIIIVLQYFIGYLTTIEMNFMLIINVIFKFMKNSLRHQTKIDPLHSQSEQSQQHSQQQQQHQQQQHEHYQHQQQYQHYDNLQHRQQTTIMQQEISQRIQSNQMNDPMQHQQQQQQPQQINYQQQQQSSSSSSSSSSRYNIINKPNLIIKIE